MQPRSRYLAFIGYVIEWCDKYRTLSLAIVSVASMVTMFAVAFWYKETYGVNIQNRVTFLFTSLIILILLAFFYLSVFRAVVNERFEWTLGVINNLSQKINTLENSQDVMPSEDKSPNKWPWGNHNTKDLDHLAAAANRFWTLYDPSDFTTAPTNKVVAEWLVTNRGVARERAGYMASILRADGLPDGPRS